MKDKRPGEQLWAEWDGHGYSAAVHRARVYCTDGHVDMENEVVQRALASSLQRDGVATGLGEGYRLQTSAVVVLGYAGHVDGDDLRTTCDEYGETRLGDTVDKISEITWIEVM